MIIVRTAPDALYKYSDKAENLTLASFCRSGLLSGILLLAGMRHHDTCVVQWQLQSKAGAMKALRLHKR